MSGNAARQQDIRSFGSYASLRLFSFPEAVPADDYPRVTFRPAGFYQALKELTSLPVLSGEQAALLRYKQDPAKRLEIYVPLPDQKFYKETPSDKPVKAKKPSVPNDAAAKLKKGKAKGGPVIMPTRPDLAFGSHPRKEEYNYG